MELHATPIAMDGPASRPPGAAPRETETHPEGVQLIQISVRMKKWNST